MTAFKSLTFPWETRFKDLVQKIEDAFKRIKDIASAGHLGMSVRTHEMVENIGYGQDQIRDELSQTHIELRQQLKLEMKQEMQSLFQTFDRDWISRFEQIMTYSIQRHPTQERLENSKAILLPPNSPAVGSADSNCANTSQGKQ